MICPVLLSRDILNEVHSSHHVTNVLLFAKKIFYMVTEVLILIYMMLVLILMSCATGANICFESI